MPDDQLVDAVGSLPRWVYSIGLRTRFRGLTRREGMLLRGPAGWGEWSPFVEYDARESANWLAATLEACFEGFPAAVRTVIPVNVTVPAVTPEAAQRIVSASACRTAKVKVAEQGQTLDDDINRVAAVRQAIGRDGTVRVDANGAWSVQQGLQAVRALSRFDLEYVEQPCRTVEELAELRRLLARQHLDVAIAADESIRRTGDPQRVKELAAADIAVLKVQPLGGVRRCLEVAEQLGLPVVVSSALETSVGISMGLALAAALPELPFACGLNTVQLFDADVTDEPLVESGGVIRARSVTPESDAEQRLAADEQTAQRWDARLLEVCHLAGHPDRKPT